MADFTPKGYTTRGQVENYLLITVDPSFYTQVDTWIAAIETQIEQMTGRVFSADDTASERLYDGDGSNSILIDEAAEIEGVEILDTDGSVLSTLTSTDYYTYPANETTKSRIVLNSGSTFGTRWSRGRQNIRVNAKWGQAVPADLQFAATVLVAGIINFSDSSEGEIQSMSIGRYSVTYKTEEQKEDFNRANEILKTYKRYGDF